MPMSQMEMNRQCPFHLKRLWNIYLGWFMLYAFYHEQIFARASLFIVLLIFTFLNLDFILHVYKFYQLPNSYELPFYQCSFSPNNDVFLEVMALLCISIILDQRKQILMSPVRTKTKISMYYFLYSPAYQKLECSINCCYIIW